MDIAITRRNRDLGSTLTKMPAQGSLPIGPVRTESFKLRIDLAELSTRVDREGRTWRKFQRNVAEPARYLDVLLGRPHERQQQVAIAAVDVDGASCITNSHILKRALRPQIAVDALNVERIIASVDCEIALNVFNRNRGE